MKRERATYNIHFQVKLKEKIISFCQRDATKNNTPRYTQHNNQKKTKKFVKMNQKSMI